jgi:hypothetical protein
MQAGSWSRFGTTGPATVAVPNQCFLALLLPVRPIIVWLDKDTGSHQLIRQLLAKNQPKTIGI